MLIALHFTTNSTLAAADVSLADGPFLCPECRERVFLHGFTSAIPYFSHASTTRCVYGSGETSAHRRCKREIYEVLNYAPNATDLALEARIGNVRPDVYAIINDVPVAIEVQLSALQPEEVFRRTEEYARQGIYVLWLIPWKPILNRRDYSPPSFEVWLHEFYFGRVYFWQEALTVIPYHFSQTTMFAATHPWRGSKGLTQHDDYPHPTNGFDRLVRGRPLDLTQDFRGVTRPKQMTPSLQLPEATIWIDRYDDFPRTTAD